MQENLQNSNTLPRIIAGHAAKYGDTKTAIRDKAYGIWQKYSWTDYYRFLEKTAAGFAVLELKRGDAVCLIVENHPEWLFSASAAHALGATTINLFTSSVAEELSTSISRVHCPIVVVQDQEQADKLIEIKEKLPFIRKVVYIDPTGMTSYGNDPWLMSYNQLLVAGEKFLLENENFIADEIKKGRPDDIALMIQTSGTTGIPKLAMLSHRNLISMALQWTEANEIKPEENWISISPPAWIVDQMWCLGVALQSAMTINFPETAETVLEDFRDIGPSIIITSSRFWEDMASSIRVKISDAGWLKRNLFYFGESVGKKVVNKTSKKNHISSSLSVLYKLMSLLVYRPLLDRLGCSHFRSAFTGGHPISPDVILFFRAIGLNLKQCYGLTEAGGIFQIQPNNEVKLETVGKPLPQTEVRIADDQEVLVKSKAVFSGYYNDYETTQNAFHDGWLKTGDAGYIDDDGHLLIIGRKEDIIRNKSGEAFSPDFIETRLKFSPYIKEAVIFGESRPFITAMINIDLGNVGNWAEEKMIPYTTYMDLAQQPAVEELILAEVRKVNEQLPGLMKVKTFILLYKLLDADDEELTRTGKVRRRFVYGLYIKIIEAMYRHEKNVRVQGKVRYRDGRIGEIETTVNIMKVG
ncbi:MAG: long-chain fatty acid--CoA ligase [Deltaproteobacteria bacterium HGW-Deltaproteobacteria-12]|jgi:long-chain acyl-CoA synthetase|nr:MAG: long-chain fatty acid--CoA ligase [Deltaproteobacteria bacterium HGW-Deltaproteobacteria-12]